METETEIVKTPRMVECQPGMHVRWHWAQDEAGCVWRPPFMRADLDAYAARLVGSDLRYRFARQWLPRAWPRSKYGRRGVRMDAVQPGDLIEVAGYESRSTRLVRYLRIEALDAEGFEALVVSDVEALQALGARR